MSVPKLLTIKQFCAVHPAFTEAGIRHLVFNENTNGFHKCIRRIGSRILIVEKEFFVWVNELDKRA